MVAEELPHAIPEGFQSRIKNIAFIIEGEPSGEVRRLENLAPDETLLGYYRGISLALRGENYGIGATLPDTITLYRIPIMKAAEEEGGEEETIRRVIRDTIWHEVAHHFGFDEYEVSRREALRRRRER